MFNSTFSVPRVCICNVLRLEKVDWVVSHACTLLTATEHHRDSIAVSVFVFIFVEFDKYWILNAESETNPNDNLMMRRAGLSSIILTIISIPSITRAWLHLQKSKTCDRAFVAAAVHVKRVFAETGVDYHHHHHPCLIFVILLTPAPFSAQNWFCDKTAKIIFGVELCGVEWGVGAYKQIILIHLQFGKLFFWHHASVPMTNMSIHADCDDDDLMGKWICTQLLRHEPPGSWARKPKMSKLTFESQTRTSIHFLSAGNIFGR